MKKLLALLLLLSSTIVLAQKIDRKVVYKYSEDVEFTLLMVSKSRSTDRGTYTIKAKKGDRFAIFIFNFKNKS